MEQIQVINQREIQRRGGKCSRYPSSCIIWDILKEAGLAERAGELIIFDATYGEGRFYTAWPRRPFLLLAADIAILHWEVRPDAFIQLPVWASWRVVERLGVKPDVYVLDPPFRMYERGRGVERRDHYLPRNGLGTPEVILREGVRAASRLQAEWLLIKYAEPVKPEGWVLVAERYFRMFLGPVKVFREYTSWVGLFRRSS